MTFTLRVADISTRVTCEDATLTLAVSAAVRPFLAPGDRPEATIAVTRAAGLEEPRGTQLFDAGLVWRLYRHDTDFVFSFSSAAFGPAPYKLARFDSTFTSCVLVFNESYLPGARTVDPLEFPLPELAMIAQLARGRGVEIHGCGIIDRDGSACLFAGQSGAGKSTIARLWHKAGATVLSDDRLVLRLRDDRVWMYGTPWHGEEAFASPASAPLSRLFFLHQASQNGMRPTRGADTLARLFGCCFPPFYDRAGMDFTLEALAGVIDRVPCSELSFVPDATIVDFVRSGTVT